MENLKFLIFGVGLKEKRQELVFNKLNFENIMNNFSNFENDPYDLIKELKSSGLQWLSLGKLNYMAKKSIENVCNQADSLLNSLPTKAEALKIIQDDGENLIL